MKRAENERKRWQGAFSHLARGAMAAAGAHRGVEHAKVEGGVRWEGRDRWRRTHTGLTLAVS